MGKEEVMEGSEEDVDSDDEIMGTSDDITRMVYFIHQRLAIQTRGEA